MSASITEKSNLKIYLLFFLVGIVSEIISRILPFEFLIILIEHLQGILYQTGLLGVSFDLVFLFGYSFPFLVCSVLLTIVLLYIQKKPSFIFALKNFSIFMVIFLLSFIFLRYLFFLPFLFLLILFIIGSVALKPHPSMQMSLKASAVSFSVLFVIFSIGFMERIRA